MFTTTRFDGWDLPQDLLDGLSEAGFEHATAVQKDTIPIARIGTDLIGQARTGSGKTIAFGLPVMESATPTGKLQALILAPTRELAQQVMEELDRVQGTRGLRLLSVYGGTDLEKQAKLLDDGVDVIIGTPGRVMDMADRGHIDLASPSMFVLDEADRMLDMGFFPDIMWVVERMTNRNQTLLFSATFPQEILDAASEFMTDPEYVVASTPTLDIPDIDQHVVRIGRSNKLWVLGRLLTASDGGQTMVFTNTKRMVDLLVERLKKHGFEAKGLHGDLSQAQRDRILDTFRAGTTRTIIATDVAARGIDVDDITLVVNYDVPSTPDDYVHRIGRTGRLGRTGAAWTFVSKDDRIDFVRIRSTLDLEISESEPPALPEGTDRDPVRKQADYEESEDAFGFVTLVVTLDEGDSLTAREIERFLLERAACTHLHLGRMDMAGGHGRISVHRTKVDLALQSFKKHRIEGLSAKVEVASSAS